MHAGWRHRFKRKGRLGQGRRRTTPTRCSDAIRKQTQLATCWLSETDADRADAAVGCTTEEPFQTRRTTGETVELRLRCRLSRSRGEAPPGASTARRPINPATMTIRQITVKTVRQEPGVSLTESCYILARGNNGFYFVCRPSSNAKKRVKSNYSR